MLHFPEQKNEARDQIKQKATVIGCGVIGLSSGIRLLEAGFDVEIIARDIPPHTTSDTAAAIWYPYQCYPEDKALEWGRQTLDYFYDLMDQPECGVYPVSFTEYLPDDSPDPWWMHAVRNFSLVDSNDIPPIYKDRYFFEVPFVDTSIYMPWLVERFKKLGGNISQREVRTIDTPELDSELIINCSGTGAARLADDRKVFPVQGQAVRITWSNDGGCCLDQHGEFSLCYVLPRRNDTILGGTAVEGIPVREPDEQVTEEILRKAKRLDPSLEISEVLGSVVGLRPARTEVRLEAEHIDGRLIINNYGHSGTGFTLSWGCTDEVVEFAKKTLI